MNRKLQTSLISLLLLVTCACAKIKSSEVDNDTFFGYYGVSYSEEDARNSYSVRYAVGGSTGTTVELDSPSRIQVNGKDLMHLENAISGSEYGYSYSGVYTEEPAVFVWTRDDGTQVTNSITPVKAVSVSAPANGASHSKAAAMVIQLGGEALKAGESFVAELHSTSAASGTEKTWLSRSVSGGTQITFAASEFADFKTGPAKLSVRRERSIDPQAGHEKKGGLMTSKFNAVPIALTINP